MKILTWSIINNEIDYLKDIIPYHLSWVDAMYFLDTGSTDGSIEFLEAQSKLHSNIFVEKYHTSYIPDFSVEWKEMKNPFPEVDVRNYALTQVEKMNYDWLIQLDGDEIFLPITKSLIDLAEKNFRETISLSTINPVETLSKHPKEQRINVGDFNFPIEKQVLLYDPHARIWRSNLKVRFHKNPVFGLENQFHCIPTLENKHLYHYKKNIFLKDIVHYHLHWMYGKKVECFFANKSIYDRKEISFNQKINHLAASLPKLFWDRRKEWINYER